MKKILVTGVSGFSGYRIACYLKEKGYNIYGIVRCKDLKKYDFPVIEQDLSQPLNFVESFDAIIHAAGCHPGHTLKKLKLDNIDSTSNIIDFARKNSVQKVIFLSTVSVHGEIHTDKIDENTPIINPSPYGISKYMAELLLKECATFDSICFRLPGIIGVGAKNSWLPSVFLKFRKNEPVKIYSPDFMINNFVHIDDVASFIDCLLSRNTVSSTFILGTKEKISIWDCVKTVKKLSKSNSIIEVEKSVKQPFCLNVQHALNYGFLPRSPSEALKDSFSVFDYSS